MKVKELIELLKKQEPENELFYNSTKAFSDGNMLVDAVYTNRITFYTFSDGKTYSYTPIEYKGQEVGLTDKVVTVLTDETF